MKHKPMQRIRNNKAMTFIEMMIVAVLISIIGLVLYNSMANGLRVWNYSRKLVLEEDIVIFFDKLTQDLRNAYPYSQVEFEGTPTKVSFPTKIQYYTTEIGSEEVTVHDEIGKVEYFYDTFDNTLFKRKATYAQAMNQYYQDEVPLAKALKNIKFKYGYITDTGLVMSDYIKNRFPQSIEVEVSFEDHFGQRTLKKLIEIPVEI